ncbi:MAG TPA: CCA tRNA nucleotidyltransferase [Acetobacteraceae bacterium]|jgi:poly(A) polymerase/tRNA nucleotidyltransferase (CCA-adding enzyme)
MSGAPTDLPALRIPPPAFLADPGLAAVLAALPEARVVGGAVRDTLAGRPVAEIDLATPLTPEAVAKALEASGIRAVPTGLEHGTVTAVADGRGFEITTLRRDVETDGRHAVVTFTEDWRADAARRDFTINAMSMTRLGEVFDYFGGIADLRAGIVRFVGDPATRIAEDYLRILRYFRFFAGYAGSAADPAALAAVRAGVPGLARLSAERVWGELARILAAPDPRAAVALMGELGVLPAVLPEGSDPAPLASLVEAGAPADPILRLAALLTGDAAALAARLRLSAADRDRLAALRRGPVPRPGDEDPALRRLLADEPAEPLIGRTWLAGGAAPDWVALRARLAAMPRPVFPLEGRDVLALGEPEGPRVGNLLRAVRQWWRDGGCAADKEACRAELMRRM